MASPDSYDAGRTTGGLQMSSNAPAAVASSAVATPSDPAAKFDQNLDPATVSHDQLVAEFKALGVQISPGQDLPPDQLKFLLDELDAQKAGHAMGNTLSGFSFKDVGNMHDFMALVKQAEAFAAVTGWSYFPPASALLAMSKVTPPGGWDASQMNALFYNALPQQAKEWFPGAKFGQSTLQYMQSMNVYRDTIESYTGQRNLDQGTLDQAIREGWSTTQFQNYMTNNAALQQQYGWLKYGQTFQQWKDYKLSKKQEIISRYGLAAADQDLYYFQDKENPLVAIQSRETAVKPQDTSKGAGQSYGSQVR